MKRKLVLYDFDGTLTHKDSMWAFLVFTFGKARVVKQIVKSSPALVLASLGLRDKGAVKERFLRMLFKELSESELKSAGKRFASEVVDGLLRPERFAKMNEFLSEGADVYIVSASLDVWLSPIARKFGVGLIATNWDFEQLKFTTPNCNYEQKVIRVKSQLNLSEYNQIEVFGNSSGDQALMKLRKK